MERAEGNVFCWRGMHPNAQRREEGDRNFGQRFFLTSCQVSSSQVCCWSFLGVA